MLISDNEINRLILSCENLELGYRNRGRDAIILSNVNLQLYTGQLTALMGANGSGKSTLIRTICSLQEPISGEITINGELLSKTNVAKQIAVVLTSPVFAMNFTVFDMVSTGRIPHTNWLGKLQERDIEVVNKSLEAVGINSLSDRLVSQLSDGERQKMMIAKALAQESPIIILDEPTAHLDLVNRVEVSKLLRKLAHTENKTILMATHELDLAIQIADRIWLIENDVIHVGAPEDLIINNNLQSTFNKMSIDFDEVSGTFKVKPQNIIPICFINKGNSQLEIWTERLLKKIGFYLSQDNTTELNITIDNLKNTWTLNYKEKKEEFYNFASLGDRLRKIIISKKK